LFLVVERQGGITSLGCPGALNEIASQLPVLSDGHPASDFFFPATVLHGKQADETIEMIKIAEAVDVTYFCDQRSSC
jgi:hypothetical protein